MGKMINWPRDSLFPRLIGRWVANVTRRARLGIIANEDTNSIKGKIRRRTKQ